MPEDSPSLSASPAIRASRSLDVLCSDFDVLVVLDDLRHPTQEIDRTGELTSRVSFAHDVSISRVFVDEETRE